MAYCLTNGNKRSEPTRLKMVCSMTRRSAVIGVSAVTTARSGDVSGRKSRTPPMFKMRLASAVMRASCVAASEARTEERQEPMLLP